MKRFAVGCLAVIGFLVVMVFALGGTAIWYFGTRVAAPELDERIILALDLRGRINEKNDDFFGLPGFPPLYPSISEITMTLEQASRDQRVKALFVRLDDTAHGWASATELHNAVLAFSRSGKPALAHATSFGEIGPGNEGYFLATAFDEIDVQPGGLVGLTGLSIAQPFARGLLDLIGVEPNVIKRSEYKTALDTATDYEISDANNEMMQTLLEGFDKEFVDVIAQRRDVLVPTVRRLIDQGPLLLDEALNAGLVDHASYLDQSMTRIEDEHDAVLVDIVEYQMVPMDDVSDDNRPFIALVTAVGMITQGGAEGADGIGADRLADELASAIDDPLVDGIVLRLDTGGGSAVASETIARELMRAKEAGLPVVVSMSNAAASGGYWIAQAADRIVAQPMTVTGSIGVILAKPSLEALWARLGVTWSEISHGDHAAMWSLNRRFNNTERARLEVLIDAIYLGFKQRVADGRNLSLEVVEEIARGRVWTGRQAMEIGLVDRLGGLDVAAIEIASLLDIDDAERIDLIPYPPPPSPFDQIEELISGGLDPGFDLQAWQKKILGSVTPGPVTMPPIIVR